MGEKRRAPADDRPRSRIRFNRTTSRFEGITREDLRAWGRATPGIDLLGELAKAEVYLRGEKPGKYKDLYRFLTNWMRRASRPPKRTPPPPELAHLVGMLQAPTTARYRTAPARVGDLLRVGLGEVAAMEERG